VIRNADHVMQQVAAVPGVRAVMPRILVTGLLSTSSGTEAVLLQGVDSAAEAPLHDPAEDLVAGTFLSGPETDPIVLGAGLVEQLDLELGDRLVLTTSDPNGDVTRALFHLSGIIRTGSRQADEALAYTSIPALRGAVGMQGMLTQVGVLGEPGQGPGALADSIDTAVAGGQPLEVLPWQKAVPEMVGFTQLDDAFGYVYMIVIFLVVLFSITNTFLMAVLERVRELGLLSALGLRGRRVARLLLAETTLMTVLAMTAGFSLGLAAHFAAAHWGIPLSAWGLKEVEISGIDMADLVIHSEIRPVKWAVGSALVAFATVASSLYPAWRASRLAPAEAMRFFE